MSGNKFVVDTNIIIYHLTGNVDVELLLQDKVLFISSITYTELLSHSRLSADEEKILRKYLKAIQVIHTNEFVCEIAASLRKNSKIKLPDAFIAATSFFLDIPLITFDNDFDKAKDLRIIKLSLK
jgi:predicted nucleic acid-binding protein